MINYDLYSDRATYALIFLFGSATLYADTMNPFSWMNQVKNPFVSKMNKGGVELTQDFLPTIRTSFLWKVFAYYKCGWHIVSNVRAGAKAKNLTLDAIISDIHALRFNPSRPYLISGDHFNVLYPRNLGVFYHSTLDPNTALSEKDWEDRQRIYLQTVAFALSVFSINGDCTTTIVPVGRRSLSCINIYRYPSDSLYGIMFGLAALRGGSLPYDRHFNTDRTQNQLSTMQEAEKLLMTYTATLTTLLERYLERVFDPATGLIKTSIAISSAKDSVLRESSFYDNVILWKTLTLAEELSIPTPIAIDLPALKTRILETFWSEEAGHFLDDLSLTEKDEKNYSADWLIATITGFLDVTDPTERAYLQKTVDYTINQKLDLPFPLRYQKNNRSHDEVFLVRYVVPAYGGSGIWSFWGAEFIKLLTVLSPYDGNESFLARAEQHIAQYENRMVKYKGYPEIFTSAGKMLRSPLYQSVRQTGWVVGFEQARKLVAAYKKA